MYKKAINKLIFIILLYFCSTASLFANVSSYKFAFSSNQNNLEETLFSININKLGSKDTVLGYINYSNNQVFLPLQEVFFLLGFTAYLVKDNDAFNIEGTYFNYKFSLNLNNDYIKTNTTKNNNNIPFNAFIINNSNEIFINTDYLANNFSLLLEINRADLSIVFKALNNKFADEILAEAEKKRQALNSNSSAKNHKVPITYANRPTFWVNTLGVKYTIDYTKNTYNNQHSYNNNISLSTGGLLFGFDSTINATYRANSNKYTSKSSYINFSRPFTNRYIKYISLVDTTTLAINGVSKAQLQQGIFASSLDDYGINADKTITIAGALQPDEEVELYKNNVLIDYAKNTNGSYNFTITNVNLGINNFKLVFYDKYGNTREETKTYVINNETLNKNSFSSKFSVTTGRKDLLVNENKNKSNTNTNNKKYINVNAQISYGLGGNLNVTSFYSLQQNPSYNSNIASKSNNYEQQNIVGLRSNFYLLGASVVNSVYYNTNNTQTGFNSNVYTSFLKGSLYGGINYYGNTQTQESYQGSNYNKYKITARYNNSIKFINLPFSFNYTSNKVNNASNYTTNKYQGRVSKSLIRYIFTSLSVKYTQTKSNTYSSNYTSANIGNNYNYKGKINYNNKLNFTLNQNTKLQSIENSLSYKINNNHNAKLTFNSTLVGSKKYTHTAGFGYSGKYKFGLFGVGVSGSNSTFNASFSYSAALIYHSKRHKVFISPNISSSRQAKIIAFTYIDNNANNKYDKNIDTKLNNAGLVLNGANFSNNYNPNYSIIENIKPYSSNKIYLSEEALDDITLAPYYQTSPVLAIPNATNFIDVPAKQSGNIYGLLYNNNKSVVAYYKIQLVESNNNKVIATAFTNKNGQFAIEAIPYGNYIITTTTKDGTKLTTNSFNVKEFEVNADFYLK